MPRYHLTWKTIEKQLCWTGVEMLVLTPLFFRPHPVKPITSSQSEKKEGRSVLEKLKSTINPGRSTHQVTAEPEKSQVLLKYFVILLCPVMIINSINYLSYWDEEL